MIWVGFLENVKKPCKLNDRLGMFVIIGSVLISMFGTIADTPPAVKRSISVMELTLTIFFAVEYFLRAYAARRRLEYILSFYGLIDFLTWVPLIFLQQGFLALRLLRIVNLLSKIYLDIR